MRILEGIAPMEVFEIFEDISRIPRGSGNEEEISNYIVNFAKKLGLVTYQDSAWNVIVKKNGTKGYENLPAVILQGHIDMVCEKNADIEFDFSKDPLKLKVESDFITAEGTTLGADNGIAVAYILALLQSDSISHPPIEAVFTSDEEAGMNGAKNLDFSLLDGRTLINLDSEEEGHILSCCAGGLRAKITVPLNWVKSRMDFKACKIVVKGLKGGHSGADIHLQRANANKLMGRLLNNLVNERLVWIREINGGNMDNAIPRECESVICFEPQHEGTIKGICEAFQDMSRKEYRNTDEDIMVEVIDLKTTPAVVFSYITAVKALSVLMLIPNGVKTMSKDIDGLVESSNNIGVVRTDREEITFTSAVRSSVSSRKELICEEMRVLCALCGVDFETRADYPAWEYKPDSRLRTLMSKVYKNMFNKDAKIDAIHAGLECGLFSEKLPGCDIVSIGPEMSDVHTPDERLSISSVLRTWDFLKEVLKELK